MKTGRPLIVLLALLALASCSSREEGHKGPAEVMKDYSKALSSAPQKAQETGEKADERLDEMKKSIEELDK